MKVEKIKRNCIRCSSEFFAIPYRVKTGNAKYCSKKCHYENIKELKIGVKPRDLVYLDCQNFNKAFSTHSSNIKYGRGKYCSPECHYAHRTTKEPIIDKLKSRIDISINGCWEWNSTIDSKGYGMISINGKIQRAHRVAYSSFVGQIPDGLLIMHKCDNRKCCNPSHLQPGTAKDNIRDMHNKGRAPDRRGEKCGKAKLTWVQVDSIRSKFDGTYKSKLELAAEFKTSLTNLESILKNRSWAR